MPLTLVSSSPTTFYTLTQGFSVTDEILQHRHKFNSTTCDQQGTMYNVPRVIITCTDGLRFGVKSDHPISRPIIVVACINHGINILTESPDITSLLSVRLAVHEQLAHEDPVLLETILTFFRGLNASMSLSDTISSGIERKTNIWYTRDLRDSINVLYNGLEINRTLIMAYAWIATLAIQSNISDEHRKILQTSLNAFFKRIRMQASVGDLLLKVARNEQDYLLEKPVVASSTSKLKGRSLKELAVRLRGRNRDELIELVKALVDR